MITKCRICGKEFEVLYPELWRYVRAKRYLCSWKCLRLYDQKGSEDMYKKVKKDGTPAKKPGPAPKMITDPDVEAKLPEEPVKAPETVRIAGKSEKPRKITEPVVYDGLVVREVEGNFGRYRRTDIGSATYIDFESTEGLDTLSLTVDQWRSFREESAKAAKVLGVEL